MELILFTGNECQICKDVEEKFLKKHKKEIDSGEATIVNLDDDANEQAQKFWMKHELPLAPCIVVVSEDEKLIATIDPDKYLDIKANEARPTFETSEVVKQP